MARIQQGFRTILCCKVAFPHIPRPQLKPLRQVTAHSTKSYCTPQRFKGERSTLFHNRGDGTFENLTEKAGLYDPTSKALGVALIDYDNDGWLDLFVSNDTEPNKLYHNNNGTFTDVAVAAGVAFGEAGTTSQSELSLTLGLGRPAHGKDVNVRVIWPSGRRDSVTNAKPEPVHHH